MFWSTFIVLAAVRCATAIAQSTAFVDSSTGIVFQRVQTNTDGSSVAIALPSQGAAASDAIIQLTGPASHSFAGVSPSIATGSIFAACCWCCTAQRRSIHGGFRQPMFGARRLGAGGHEEKTAVEPVLTAIGEPEITESTFKVTFRCQNCTFSETKGSKFTTLTTVFSTNEVSSISDPNLKVNPATDIITEVQFNLADARIANYWSIVNRH
ncbi:hypothetical protein D9619_004570 [Psilocybe cf. subviscida]|uniref:Cellobiose dehydrogenase-like cytochrome domain-containing protein n=1 Tax=Psilocybe cf. subviscida TaxID=2480587 RepID=A0A8H5BRE5_9AGAR|nr:hypothetical protein D9619_004570 [Psilocybe cf. subviscida]